jgi:hypothetical protein
MIMFLRNVIDSTGQGVARVMTWVSHVLKDSQTAKNASCSLKALLVGEKEFSYTYS